jgi:D-alanyl-D-alanine carboxypeptidase/D-alanyl-D-alanine-endopeptidase (penicillin-binding protein 4)
MKRNGPAIIFLQFLLFFLVSSCSVQRQIGKVAKEDVLNAAALKTAHVGISIYDPASGKYWYNHNGEKYFVPASNVKIPTCYSAMKYLGDSLVGLRYGIPEEKGFEESVFAIRATGDPTFLHKDFKRQNVFEFLKQKFSNERLKCALYIDTLKNSEGWGNGWSWNDYQEAYMAEHNTFPVYGNVVNLQLNEPGKRAFIDTFLTPGKKMRGQVLITQDSYFDSLVNESPSPLSMRNIETGKLRVERGQASNDFRIFNDSSVFQSLSIPFVTNGAGTTIQVIEHRFQTRLEYIIPEKETNKYFYDCSGCDYASFHIRNWMGIHSQPTDSVLRPMMHRSDNFFAEQMLLMVSNERLGVMNDEKIIDTLLRSDFSDLPHKPNWVDGSGLSRYNLFTPDDMVAILEKMKNEFGMERIKNIFPTGGRGTLTNYYKSDSNYLFAKTGTLSGVVALSGFLYTKKGMPLIFSVLVNNHQSSATEVRRAIEKFLQAIRRRY